MDLSFKNRIATLYMVATALVVAVVFVLLYGIVRSSVISNVDNDLIYEAEKHTTEVDFYGSTLKFRGKQEWEEREHREVEVNPVFIQLLDEHGNTVDRSPNLKELHLTHDPSVADRQHYTSHINERHLRQVRVPIIHNGKTSGYIVAAMSLDPAIVVLDRLRTVLLVIFPMVLLGLFFITRMLAGRSILPVIQIRDTADRITRDNLNERVPVSDTKDELQDLSVSINRLLDWIEEALERERQFTSNASHELRTPLSVLRGTLEVLIRKPRTQQEYEQKVKEALKEIDRLSNIMEQLLTLSRIDDSSSAMHDEQQPISDVVRTVVSNLKQLAAEHQVTVQADAGHIGSVTVPKYAVELILANLIGNAIKYSDPSGVVTVSVTTDGNNTVCSVTDHGIGIRKEDQAHIFEPFFRSDAMEHPNIPGNGLGLTIAQRTARSISGVIQLQSIPGQGSTFSLILSKS